MTRSIERLFRAPCSVPNGVQVTGEGLWIVDQITDQVFLVEVAAPSEYGVTKLISQLSTESSNSSGLTTGDGSLWLAANGPATTWRPARPSDAASGEILRVDATSGNTLVRFPLPGSGGTHGVEYDHHDPGHLWLTTLKSQTLTKVRISDWSVQHVLPLPYTRAHGVVRLEDGIWVVFTSDRVIVKLSVSDGAELDRVDIPTDAPEPHGLSSLDSDLLYCDATSGWIARIHL